MQHPTLECLLCNKSDQLDGFFRNEKSQMFWKCQNCGVIFKDPTTHPTKEAENNRYRHHQNDVSDLGYQNFLKPVVEAVVSSQKPTDTGLDFGCGPNSVVAYLLKEKGYHLDLYDPLFYPDRHLLKKKFDYITCTEVIEHFLEPRKSFEILSGLLKPGAKLYIKTSLTDDVLDFSKWYYHRDETHVIFYNQKSLQYIEKNWKLQNLNIEKSFITLESPRD